VRAASGSCSELARVDDGAVRHERGGVALVEEAPQNSAFEIREPTDVACRIAGVGWRSEPLRLRVKGPRFARAARVAASVT